MYSTAKHLASDTV